MRKSAADENLKCIPPDTVAQVGRALFGQQWHLPLAKTLKVPDRTLRRWINDGCPSRLAPALRRILDARKAEIETALTSLDNVKTDQAED